MAIDGSAVSATLCGTVCNVKDEGEALRPDGSPEAITETVPTKPPLGTMDTCTVEEVPGAIEGAEGVTAMVNEGGGGGGWPDDPFPPLPQPLRTKESPMRAGARCLAINRQAESLPSLLCLRFKVNSVWRKKKLSTWRK